MSLCAQSLKYMLSKPWSAPSNDPWLAAKVVIEANVCWDGVNTKTPELKQSGQPTSGAADNSSRSNSSSQFLRTCQIRSIIIYIRMDFVCAKRYILTRASASMKTHFSYCVSLQQCSLVNVIPNSGLCSTARLASSFESNTLTSFTKLNTDDSFSLEKIK